MEKEDARKQSREVLHERRKQVIRMHRKGVAVMEIVAQTGLSWTAVNTALTNQGKTRWMIIDEAFNSDKLIEFLEALIKDTDRKVFLILDT